MEETLLTEALKQGALVAVLALSGYILWKRYDKLTERTQAELKELRNKMDKYLEEDKRIMQDLIAQCTESIKKQTIAMDRNSKVTECLIREMQEFKEDEVYKRFQADKHSRLTHKPHK